MNGSLKKSNQAAAAVWAVLGTLFLIAGAAMLLLRDDMPQVPRADIAYIGFGIVGVVFWVIAIAARCGAADKNAMIEERDERSQLIAGKAGLLAFVMQTVLLSSALFLLCFMGFATAPVMLTLLCLIAVSVCIYLAASLYYQQKL